MTKDELIRELTKANCSKSKARELIDTWLLEIHRELSSRFSCGACLENDPSLAEFVTSEEYREDLYRVVEEAVRLSNEDMKKIMNK